MLDLSGTGALNKNMINKDSDSETEISPGIANKNKKGLKKGMTKTGTKEISLDLKR